LFCEIPANRIVDSNELVYAIRDMYPVTELHTLIIPRRHTASYFDLEQSEFDAITELLKRTRASIMRQDPSVEAFNIGINDGKASGQTISHCHVHLMPRRKGDVQEPRGGVRHTIPGRGNY
jgi:diadenosine tetraphosphate (Ap4A) HIT family hydrolase